MSRIFEIVQAMSGQGNCITIPAPYLDFVFGDPQAHLLGAILNQLVFWSGKPSSQENGWFYKTHEELAAEIRGVKPDQVRKAVDKLITKYLPGVILEAKRKVNGTPKKHYRVDGDALITKIFPPVLETAVLPNGNGDIAESKRQKSQMETAESPNLRNGNIADSFLYTDHYTDQNKQIIKPSCPPAAPTDGEEFISERLTREATEIIQHLSNLTSVKFETSDGNLQHIRARLRNATATKAEMLVVVDHLVASWLGTKYARGLNPAKIFSSEKFSSNLLAAKAWDAAGRPACSSEATATGNDSTVDSAERDAAYRRFTSGVGATKKPSELEKMVRVEADRANVRNMGPAYSQPRWNQIWKECAQRQQGVKAA
ncbi:conserved phage C-terminal domain-containing protein [Rahnella inusitata]|uniref:conserved phage C-terminal domain-containing protein n=1 Tax=Rahnella inusitata TaxID=58169 RepID=UPI001BC830B5|nr:conserved phage C-terminal domain-containing protein [Rahnella inusitata]QUT13462.1 conserved phage C-terminal domain-containing protein [Rahnella inusitata]